MANNTNALAGIFSGLGVAASSAASNSASNAYQKTLEINQALRVLDQERDFKRQLKQDAVNEYNQEQKIQSDTNVKTKDFINNTLKTLENEYNNNDFTTEELGAKKEIYINSINEKGYTGEQLLYANAGIEGINAMFRGEKKDKEINNSLDLLVKDGNKLDEKAIRQGNYSSTNTENYYNLIDNSRSLQQNATRSNRAATATAIGNFMDDLSQREYVRGVLEKYDVSKFDPENVEGTAFLQLDKTVGPAEAVAIQEVAELYRTNNIADAFAAIKTMQTDKNTDRANINSAIGRHTKQVGKIVKDDISNKVTIIKDFDKYTVQDIEGQNIYLNNSSNFKLSEGIPEQTQHLAFLGALKTDIDEFVNLFEMRKAENMMPEAKEIAKDIAELDATGREYYLAGYLTKVGKGVETKYVWNTTLGDIDALYYKQFKGKTTSYDQLGSVEWDKGRIAQSRELLAERFELEGNKSKSESGTYDLKTKQTLALFQKYGAIFEAKIQNPYSREARSMAIQQKKQKDSKNFEPKTEELAKKARLDKVSLTFSDTEEGYNEFLKYASKQKLSPAEIKYIKLNIAERTRNEGKE